MTVESDLFTALRGLVSDRVYALIAPQTVVALPRITYQQVGGRAVNFLESTAPSRKNARFQVNGWAATAEAAALLSRQIEDAMRPLNVVVLGAPVAGFEPETKLYGSRQDFSLWHTT